MTLIKLKLQQSYRLVAEKVIVLRTGLIVVAQDQAKTELGRII